MPAIVPVVLVVEDRPGVRHLLEVALTQEGLRVVAVGDADDALAAAVAMPPDLVLLDLLLPGNPSASFLRALRQLPSGAETPVIVLSGLDGGLAASRAAGAQDFIAKPFDLRDLLQRVRQQLAARRMPGTPA